MKKLIITTVIIGALGAGWWLGSPLFLDKTVDEDFPTDGSTGKSQEMTLDEFDQALDDFAMEIVNEKGMEALNNMHEEIMKEAATMPNITAEEPMQKTGPTLVSEGSFFDGDASHKGSGVAKLFKNPDGSHLIRLEDFEVTNGPDLYVYLTSAKGATSSDEVKANFYNAGRLKGNKGNQNYVIPADVDISNYNGVSIYCRAFSVLFSSAELN